MDNSTEGVTLLGVFVNDILTHYPKSEVPQVHDMATGCDLSDLMKPVPMEIYNSMCDWIEQHLGQTSLKRVGRKIGESAYQGMVNFGLAREGMSMKEMMLALKQMAETMIQDPKGRGWEIVDEGEKSLLMRRTQSFNRYLQFGLLETLAYKTKVFSPKVEFLKQVTEGSEFDEYKISWL